MKNKTNYSIFITVLFLALATVVGMIFNHLSWSETNIVLVYLLAVLFTSHYTAGEYKYGIISSIASTFTFNFFFTKPYYTFSVYDSSYWITFAVMMISSFVMSTSTIRMHNAMHEAKEKEKNTLLLYTLSNHISDSLTADKLLNEFCGIVGDFFDCDISCLYLENHYKVERINNHITETKGSDTKNYYMLFHNMSKAYIEDEEQCLFPLYGVSKLLGVVMIPQIIINELSEEKKLLLMSVLENTALALDHIYAIHQQLKFQEVSLKERYRGNLLRAISHDLRTPLSGIMGTSEMLMDMSQNKQSYTLAHNIYEEATWLSLMVENILSLTKVQEGKLTIKKQMEVLEEVIGSAVYHSQKAYPDFHFEVIVPQEFIMVKMDAKLIQQVLINLLDNACKHSKENKTITIDSYIENGNACFVVEDYGIGFKEDNIQRLFEMFYTSDGNIISDRSKGVGLGLTICKAICEAHGGSIEAKMCETHQGAMFKVCLPLEEE